MAISIKPSHPIMMLMEVMAYQLHYFLFDPDRVFVPYPLSPLCRQTTSGE